jgi:hypothetical protein
MAKVSASLLPGAWWVTLARTSTSPLIALRMFLSVTVDLADVASVESRAS